VRARNIKPGFFKNEDLAECDLQARVLFIGLWCMADREGRLEYRPKRIKIEVLPYDNCNIEKLINQLHEKKFIKLYTVSNENYIEILNFGKHQNCHIKEAASTIPAPCETGASMEVATLNPESPLLNPESPLPESDASPDKSGRSYSKDFLLFWQNYPKKSGSKKAAFDQWKKLNGVKPPVETILEAIRKQIEWRKNAGDEFRPEWKDPERWIKNHMWEAELDETHEGGIAAWLKSQEGKDNAAN